MLKSVLIWKGTITNLENVKLFSSQKWPLCGNCKNMWWLVYLEKRLGACEKPGQTVPKGWWARGGAFTKD